MIAWGQPLQMLVNMFMLTTCVALYLLAFVPSSHAAPSTQSGSELLGLEQHSTYEHQALTARDATYSSDNDPGASSNGFATVTLYWPKNVEKTCGFWADVPNPMTTGGIGTTSWPLQADRRTRKWIVTKKPGRDDSGPQFLWLGESDWQQLHDAAPKGPVAIGSQGSHWCRRSVRRLRGTWRRQDIRYALPSRTQKAVTTGSVVAGIGAGAGLLAAAGAAIHHSTARPQELPAQAETELQHVHQKEQSHSHYASDDETPRIARIDKRSLKGTAALAKRQAGPSAGNVNIYWPKDIEKVCGFYADVPNASGASPGSVTWLVQADRRSRKWSIREEGPDHAHEYGKKFISLTEPNWNRVKDIAPKGPMAYGTEGKHWCRSLRCVQSTED